MSDVPEVIQSLFDNRLDMLLPKRDPAFVGQYSISNHLVNALAHLVGTDGVASHLVAADPFGNLRSRIVDTAGVNELKVDATNNLHAGIWNGADQVETALPMAVASGNRGLVCVSHNEKQIYNILTDVHDAVNHYLKVHETA